ncbi:MAG: hypothetical protein FWH27_09615, partial [Planctomycetaceae bacterium]|nr:hypothetical protein [Planctomycetaceae bacterium]
MIKSNNIIMDTSYSKAIVLASLESNDASVADEDSTIEKAALWLGCSVAEADYRHEISPKELMSSILDKPSTGKKRFRRSALEMALFYDRMILFGVPNEVCLDKLEDEGVLRVMAHAGQNFENESFGAAHPVLLFFIKMMKNPSVVKDIMRDINSTLRLVKRPPVSYKIASYAYDTILKVAFAGINLYVLQEYLTKGLLNKRLLITEECPAKDIILEAVFTVYQKTSVYPEISIIYFMAALRCIIDLWHGFMLSQITNTPFLSRKMSSIQEISSILDAPKPGASIDD